MQAAVLCRHDECVPSLPPGQLLPLGFREAGADVVLVAPIDVQDDEDYYFDPRGLVCALLAAVNRALGPAVPPNSTLHAIGADCAGR